MRAHYLKAVQALDPESFDKNLSHTAIATFDRELLYEFVETQTQPLKQTESKPYIKDESVVVPEENQKTVKEEIKLQPKEEEEQVDIKDKQIRELEEKIKVFIKKGLAKAKPLILFKI